MEYQILRDHEEPGCRGTRLGRLDAHRALQPQRVGQMRTTISRIRAGMSRAARARRLQVLVRGSAQPVVATVVVPGAACAAGSVSAGSVLAVWPPAISTVLPAQTASARAAVARASSSLTIR